MIFTLKGNLTREIEIGLEQGLGPFSDNHEILFIY